MAPPLLGCRKDGLATQRVHQVAVPDAIDVAALRACLGLTQATFAARFAFGLRAVRQWEQGERHPEGPARVLLAMTAADPEAVDALLERAGLVA